MCAAVNSPQPGGEKIQKLKIIVKSVTRSYVLVPASKFTTLVLLTKLFF